MSWLSWSWSVLTLRLVPCMGWGVGLMTLITPYEIRSWRFTTRGILHQSYDADEVDALLDDAADSLEWVSLWALITHSRMHALQAGHQHRRRSLKRRRMAIRNNRKRKEK